MDLYEILIHQNPPWSSRETVCFAVLLCLLFITVAVLIRKRKLKGVQGTAILLIYIFLFVVFASTVFTRVPTSEANYNLQLFWSYRYVLENNSVGMLEEILLNCVLLMPLGVLLPFALGKPVSVWFACLTGLVVSSCIEVCQLVFHRGLFEWDDIIHNTLGCVVGYVIARRACRYIAGRKN
ncbi:VanZ family protein [Ruminococcus sp. OA3]|uniref:VanZ family protein n=1 Tax=Ruminococcus sp. OA3 TaxID=2914164 RepID=UPI001F05956C|nr:VanZ family protein [Ruminococcus sp. OA3]MCH1982952.1 VanZ family protein [Ruminococcus sp. OA3]